MTNLLYVGQASRLKTNWQSSLNRYVRTLVQVALVVGCKTSEPALTIYIPPETAATKAALVSVQATATNTAQLVVKTSLELARNDWQLSLLDSPQAIESVNDRSFTKFTVRTFRITNLVVGNTYRFQLRFVYNHRDTLTVQRTYQHTAPGYWRSLTPVDVDQGAFTGTLLTPPPGLGQPYQQGNTIRLVATRFVSDEAWQTQIYQADRDNWFGGSPPSLSPRYGLVQFRLQAVAGVTYSFTGLGYTYDPVRVAQRNYDTQMSVRDDQTNLESSLTPTFGGSAGEIAFFTTTDRAFLLTQEGAPALWVRRGNWEQYRGQDFPEPPGTMATFVLNGVGYVVNQQEGQPPHLYAYDPNLDRWSRRADFPGASRSRGVSFSVGGKGYYGLGVAGDDEHGLRDLYQYDPTTNVWQYVTDYPGQGHRYLISYSTADKVYLGWGYESQALPSGGARQVGCIDFWEFKP